MFENRDPRAVEENYLLRALPDDRYAELLPHLEPVELAARQVLWQPDTTIHSVYFPRSCVVSLLTPLSDEQPVEAATIGREGMVGTAVVLGVRVTNVRAIAQVAGMAARIDAERFVREINRADGALFPLLLRYTEALHEQTAQAIACNRRHAIEARFARWLLMTEDRAGKNPFPLTQDFLAFMLGVRRASVTVAAGMLQRAGLISYSRGLITVLDREGLEAASCECYAVIQRKYGQLLPRVPAFGVALAPTGVGA
jgi:CRP-like cAMP-binding protein